MSDGRPAPVVAALRRPWAWLLVVLVLLGLDLGWSLRSARADERRRARSVDVQGVLLERRTEDGEAKIRFVHPATEQELTLTMPVADLERLPTAPGPVTLDADPDDPENVRLDGEVASATANLGWNLPYLVVPLAVWARRRRGVRRIERLMAGPGPSFARLAAIAPAGWRGRRVELHLWPLDAAAGAQSLCRVALLATDHLPVGGAVFDVEVKGRPRPFGTLVARSAATGGVLWPAGAGLPRRPRPRPATTVVPVPLPPEVPVPPEAARVRPPWVPLVLGGAGTLASLLLLVLVAALTAQGAGQARRVEEGRRVIAEVTGRNDLSDELALTYSLGGDRLTGKAPVDYAEDFPVGRRYPATVDLSDPSRLRLVEAPYDPVAPLVWAALPLLGAAVVLGGALRRWGGAVRVARRGGWRPMELETGTGSTSWAGVSPRGSGQIVCSVQFDPPGLSRVPSSAEALPALVAGDPQPGGRVVVRLDDTTHTVHRVGAAPRLRWWTS